MNPLEYIQEAEEQDEYAEVVQTEQEYQEALTRSEEKIANQEGGTTMNEAPKFEVTTEMMSNVLNAMFILTKQHNNVRKMHSVEEIERVCWEYQKFVPVTLTLKALINNKSVRYFKTEVGKLVYGFTNKTISNIKGGK